MKSIKPTIENVRIAEQDLIATKSAYLENRGWQVRPGDDGRLSCHIVREPIEDHFVTYEKPIDAAIELQEKWDTNA